MPNPHLHDGAHFSFRIPGQVHPQGRYKRLPLPWFQARSAPEPQGAEAVKYAEILHLQVPLLAIHRSSGVKAVGETLAQLVQIPLKNSFQRNIQCRGSHRQPDAGQRKTGCPVSLCPCCSPPTSRFFGLFLSQTNWKLSNSVRCFALWHFYTLPNHTCNIRNGIGAVVLEPF